jgi:hypothetical protein
VKDNTQKPVEAGQGRTKHQGQETANRVTLGDRGKHNPKRGDPKHVKRALREKILRLKEFLPLGDSEKHNLNLNPKSRKGTK